MRVARGFTLTELLIVIAIIGVLAALIAAAGRAALVNANRARIVLEMKNISGAIENFKNDYGSYPPNGVNPSPVNNPGPNTVAGRVQSDFVRMFKKAFPRSQEPTFLVLALCGQNLSGGPNLQNGMTPAEALYFWMGGFSDDPLYPLSGPGGPSFLDPNPGNASTSGEEILENRKRRYEFDLSRLYPQTNGELDPTSVRYVEYQIVVNGTTQDRQINFWTYHPAGSEKPLVYFDASRHKPYQYHPVYVDDPGGDERWVYPILELRKGAPNNPTTQDLVFSNLRKFQLLHAGLDDFWGSTYLGSDSTPPSFVNNVGDWTLFPIGPFTGELADTLTNFTDGAIEDAQEQ